MLCTSPFWLERPDRLKFFVSCKECMPCQINRRSEWTGRILLDMQSHDSSTFCTLTYSDSNLPTDRKINKKDIQLFIKRLRQLYLPRKIRYFATGEYGSKTLRAHYHLILFGFSPLHEHLVTKAWNLGFVSCSPATEQRAAYVAKYTTKRKGEHASFGMMSRAPGIGRNTVPAIATALKHRGIRQIPNLIRIGKQKYVLGQYMHDAVLKEIGPENIDPRSALSNDMRVILDRLFGDPLEMDRLKSLGLAQRWQRLSEMRETL